MKTVEHRRHARRTKPSPHLNAKGVRSARKLGKEMGPFALVATSGLPRAVETAVAMGFAVDEECGDLARFVYVVDDLVPRHLGFAPIQKALKDEPDGKTVMKTLRDAVVKLLDRVPEGGRLLLVSHGGIVEMTTIACMPDADYSAWGGKTKLLEGTELRFENGRFTAGKPLRLTNQDASAKDL